MKYSLVSAVLFALATSSLAVEVIVTEEEQPDGSFIPIATRTEGGTTTTPPPANPHVNEKVYAPPSSNPNQGPSSMTAPAPIQPSSTGTAPPPPGGGTGKSGNGQICVNFSGGDFHFANAGSWGSKTGQGAQAASQCFGMVAGGAMFICDGECNASGDSAPAKYTKLECNFLGDYPNCDISLVDGFSLPLQCTIPGANPSTIGGTTDLGSITHCPTTGGDNTCQNTKSYNPGSATSPPVDQYFLNANTNDPTKPGPGGNYCVFQTCSGPSDSFWNSASNPTISCQVGTKSASKKRSDGVVETRNISDVEARAVDSSLEAHVRRHVGGAHSHARAHVRDLSAMLS